MPSLRSLTSQLVQSGILSFDDEDAIHQRKPSTHQQSLHPLVSLAAALETIPFKNPAKTGKALDLEALCRWFAQQMELPYYTFDPLKIDVAKVTSVMSLAYSQRHSILAVDVGPDEIIVATSQPWDKRWVENLSHVTRKTVKRVFANPEDIDRYTLEFYQLAHSVKGASEDKAGNQISNFEQLLQLGNASSPKTAPEANDQHIVSIVDWLFQYAFEQRASDIHIEPRREQCNLRFRIDGVLHLIYQLPPAVASAITSRIKILGRMNVAEKRKPQDGRLKARTPDGVEAELRLATMPTAFGEKLVVRIFDPDILMKSLRELGFSREDETRWQTATCQPHGIVLVTGPTGSGKTTSLYSTLKSMTSSEVNICTIEDPIEMVVPEFNQTQIQPGIDLGFATGLRALLRQDPDFIMVGEIRDKETAEMAVQAALTGHLVLSTMHTNDAAAAVARMMELGIPPYLIKASVLGVMAQRLVRTLCPDCKSALEPTRKDWHEVFSQFSNGRSVEAPPEHIYEASGCHTCRGTGYLGRTGLYEILLMSDALRELVGETASISDFRDQAFKEGMQSLRSSGAEKVAAGETSLEEVIRVTSDYRL